jgi:hypothetical protein
MFAPDFAGAPLQPDPLGPPAPATGESYDFSELRAFFSVDSVQMTSITLDHVTACPAGTVPRDQRLGEPCGDPRCNYALVGLPVVPDRYALLRRFTRESRERWPQLPPEMLLQELRLDVFAVRTRVPLRVADMGLNPILRYVALGADELSRTGHTHGARHSSSWELVRILRDAPRLRPMSGFELRTASGPRSRDLFVYERDFDQLQCTRLGTLQEVLPVAVGTGALQRLMERVINRNRPEDESPNPS